MNTYRKTLILLKDLLHKSDNFQWEQWIERDIDNWDNSKSTSHHKSAFGGMGSINDLSVGGRGKVGIWKNTMFDLLKSISWTFAAKNKIQFPIATIPTIIEGAICRDCSFAEISESGIEYYISSKHLPTIITNLLPTDQYWNLTNIEALADKKIVNVDRQKLLTALTEFKINISKADNWLRTCPSCNSTNTCVYRWNISTSNNKLILTKSKNNLALKADKKKITWWRRIRDSIQ
jgi:hypothetical protein